MKLIRNIIAAVLAPLALLTFVCPPVVASQVGPGIGAAGTVNSPTSVYGVMTSTTNIGTICSLTKPEAGEWTVAIWNNATGVSGAGLVNIWVLAADGATYYQITTFNTPTGAISVSTTFTAVATGYVFQFNGPILGIQVRSTGAGITAGSIYATISAN